MDSINNELFFTIPAKDIFYIAYILSYSNISVLTTGYFVIIMATTNKVINQMIMMEIAISQLRNTVLMNWVSFEVILQFREYVLVHINFYAT